MQTPVCEIDLKTGILCSACESKLEKGEITQLDVEISKILFDLSKRFKEVNDVVFKKSIDTGDILVLVVGKGSAEKIRGRVLRILSKRLRRRIKIIEETKDYKVLSQQLLAPARVLAINIVFLPGNVEKHRIIVPKQDINKLPTNITSIQKILKDITGKEMVISFQ